MEKVQFIRRSPMSGRENSMIVEVDMEKLAMWEDGQLVIQRAFPHLSAAQREFILTGYTMEEQEIIFGKG